MWMRMRKRMWMRMRKTEKMRIRPIKRIDGGNIGMMWRIGMRRLVAC